MQSFGLELPPNVIYAVAFLFGLTTVRLLQLRGLGCRVPFGRGALITAAIAVHCGLPRYGDFVVALGASFVRAHDSDAERCPNATSGAAIVPIHHTNVKMRTPFAV